MSISFLAASTARLRNCSSSSSSRWRSSSSYFLHQDADLPFMNVSEGEGQSEGLEEGGGWVGQDEAEKERDGSDSGWVDHDGEK